MFLRQVLSLPSKLVTKSSDGLTSSSLALEVVLLVLLHLLLCFTSSW